MRKKILSFLLTLAMLLTAVPADVFAAEPAEAFDDLAGDAERRVPLPLGGLQVLEEIEISEEDAERIGTVSTDDLAADGRLRINTMNYGSQTYSSSWDEYSSNYIYNRLSTKQRKLWDLLDAVSRSYMDSTQNADRNYYNGKVYYMTKGVNYLSLGLTSPEANNVYVMFLYANPQYYFVNSGSVRYSRGALFPVVYDRFANGAARREETEKMQVQINNMKTQVVQGATDLEKARIAHDLIVRKVKYDHDYSTDAPNTPFHQSAYSVFCDSYTVCAGYTKAFELLMCAVGIDAVSVTSTTATSGHAWNAVCLNDAWYYVDCTWDDQDGANGVEFVYTWFGLSESTLTRKMDKSGAHKAEPFYTGLLPSCTLDLGSTAEQVGTAYEPVQVTEAPCITQKMTDDGMKVTMTTATADADIYYTTDGSNPSASYSRCYHYTKAFMVNSDVTVKAIAVSNGRKESEVVSVDVKGRQYTVSFKSKGGSKVASRKVWPQKSVKKPSDPTRKGYKFEGWYSNSSCTKKWEFTDKVTKDMTLYAKWTKVRVAETVIRKLKNSSGRKLDITIGKLGDVNGYQIRYSLKSNMRSSKKVLTKSYKKTISGLKANKQYYVQVRAYKLDSKKKKVFGPWSSIRTVTIRK